MGTELLVVICGQHVITTTTLVSVMYWGVGAQYSLCTDHFLHNVRTLESFQRKVRCVPPEEHTHAFKWVPNGGEHV